MTQLERDLERLFAADARARSIRTVVIAKRRRATPFAALALAGIAVAFAAVVATSLMAGPSERVAQPPAIAPLVPSPSASPATCADPLRREPDDPVVGGSKLSGGAALELRRVRVSAGETRWTVLLAVGPERDGAVPLDVAPRATLRGPDGVVPVLGYEAGPDETSTSPTTSPLRILPCSAVVLVVRTAPVGSGDHTLTLESVASAGRATAVPVFAPLTCTNTGPGAQECVNARGTRTTPGPTNSPGSP